MTTYPLYVEYIENGVLTADTWNERILAEEIAKGEVEIISVTDFSNEEE